MRPYTIKGVGVLGIWYGFSSSKYLTGKRVYPILLAGRGHFEIVELLLSKEGIEINRENI